MSQSVGERIISTDYIAEVHDLVKKHGWRRVKYALATIFRHSTRGDMCDPRRRQRLTELADKIDSLTSRDIIGQ